MENFLGKAAVVATGVAGLAHSAEAQNTHTQRTREGSVNFAKVDWAARVALRAESILETHPFDPEGAFDVPATDHAVAAFKFVRDNEQPFADRLLSPALLAKLDLNEAEWEVIEANYERVASKNVLIEMKMGLPATIKSRAIQAVILGRGENLAAYADISSPRVDQMRALLATSSQLMQEMQMQTVTEGLASEGMTDLARKFQDILSSGISAEEAKAARYYGALLTRELNVGARLMGLTFELPKFEPIIADTHAIESRPLDVVVPLPVSVIEKQPEPIPAATADTVAIDRTQIGLMGLRTVPLEDSLTAPVAPIQPANPAPFSFTHREAPSSSSPVAVLAPVQMPLSQIPKAELQPVTIPAIPAVPPEFPPGTVPMQPDEEYSPVKFDIKNVPPAK